MRIRQSDIIKLVSKTVTQRTDFDLRYCVRTFFLFMIYGSSIPSAFAIDVADYKWGFNGKVAPHRFNLLSVLVTNPSPQIFTGEIVLRKSLGVGGGIVDAPLVETVTISPNSQKWVQFYPYITSDFHQGFVNENWSVKYQGGTYDFQSPRLAKYQRIILDDPNAVISRGGALKFKFADNLFPPFVSATDALQLVVLDHVPRWEDSRRQAFIDWLYLGGTVVVLHDTGGRFPDFSGPLNMLKTPLEDQRFGSGRIIRRAQTRAQFGEDDLRQVCAGLPKNYQQANTEKSDDIVDQGDATQQTNSTQPYVYSDGSDPFKSISFLSQLKLMTKPDHNWLLLHLMFWVYIGLVFPGCYLLGKKWSDFRVVYAALLGTVTLFSLLFSYVGQRGYGESSAVHTVAIAKPLPNGFMDVAAWSNVFVTNGADYDIQHNAPGGALYSTCNDHEPVKGTINNGAEAVFKVDIPPFSNREVATRAKIPFDAVQITLDKLNFSEGKLTEFEAHVNGIVSSEVEKQFALIGNTFYALNWRKEKLVLANEAGTASGVLRVQEQRNFSNNSFYPYADDSKQTSSERYTQMFLPLLSRGLNVSREKDAEQLRLPPDALRIFLYAKIPDDFDMKSNRLGNQEGRVLYCITISGSDLQKP